MRLIMDVEICSNGATPSVDHGRQVEGGKTMKCRARAHEMIAARFAMAATPAIASPSWPTSQADDGRGHTGRVPMLAACGSCRSRDAATTIAGGFAARWLFAARRRDADA